MKPEERIQRERYSKIASQYDALHFDPEHVVALAYMRGMLDLVEAKSVLDVGAGTGRAMAYFRAARPDLRIIGVEPVLELREVGHRKGIPATDLIDGDGYHLPFRDGDFDVVCEIGVLHHVREPHRIVSEMLRVARKAVFISDSNNFGGGTFFSRLLKQSLRSLGVWRFCQLVVTRGKGYWITEGDGLFYSYSVFDNLKLIRRHCRAIHMLNTVPSTPNLYRTASHIALVGLK